MELIADGLLIATALTAGLYCLVLSRRLRNLTDSGEGIGAQIEALDRTLAETRAALAETRDGVSELRGSAKVSLSELARETASASELATRIESAVTRAESTMQRLYQAADRVEAHEARLAQVGPGSEDEEGISAMVLTASDGSPDEDVLPDGAEEAGEMPGEHDRLAPVELPEGLSAADDDRPQAASADHIDDDPGGEPADLLPDLPPARPAPSGRPRGNGAVLKAERMML